MTDTETEIAQQIQEDRMQSPINPVWKDGELGIKFLKPGLTALQNAFTVGAVLQKFPIHAERGKALCDAIDAILREAGAKEAVE